MFNSGNTDPLVIEPSLSLPEDRKTDELTGHRSTTASDNSGIAIRETADSVAYLFILDSCNVGISYFTSNSSRSNNRGESCKEEEEEADFLRCYNTPQLMGSFHTLIDFLLSDVSVQPQPVWEHYAWCGCQVLWW